MKIETQNIIFFTTKQIFKFDFKHFENYLTACLIWEISDNNENCSQKIDQMMLMEKHNGLYWLWSDNDKKISFLNHMNLCKNINVIYETQLEGLFYPFQVCNLNPSKVFIRNQSKNKIFKISVNISNKKKKILFFEGEKDESPEYPNLSENDKIKPIISSTIYKIFLFKLDENSQHIYYRENAKIIKFNLSEKKKIFSFENIWPKNWYFTIINNLLIRYCIHLN